MILLIDNYDSFSYNVYQLLGEFDEDIRVFRNDKITLDEVKALHPRAIFLSPGPGKPEDAGICIELITKLNGIIPILGVCLGHQVIAVALGGKVSYAKKVMHGVKDRVEIISSDPLFRDLGKEMMVGRYHSLAITEKGENLDILASSLDGEIMAVKAKDGLTYGLQFHPESILTEKGRELMANFFNMLEEKND